MATGSDLGFAVAHVFLFMHLHLIRGRSRRCTLESLMGVVITPACGPWVPMSGYSAGLMVLLSWTYDSKSCSSWDWLFQASLI